MSGGYPRRGPAERALRAAVEIFVELIMESVVMAIREMPVQRSHQAVSRNKHSQLALYSHHHRCLSPSSVPFPPVVPCHTVHRTNAHAGDGLGGAPQVPPKSITADGTRCELRRASKTPAETLTRYRYGLDEALERGRSRVDPSPLRPPPMKTSLAGGLGMYTSFDSEVGHVPRVQVAAIVSQACPGIGGVDAESHGVRFTRREISYQQIDVR
ncbi:hypothetical protein C8R47DRAFT_1080705 [Mycena vitilis]|nr:hypothetical protein C8R47DRAFT_1080705 [Mycena vitilis]